MASWAVSTLPTFITRPWAHRATATAVPTSATRRPPYHEPNRHYHRTSSEVPNTMSGLLPEGPVDILRDQLRRVVFRVYKQSAMPISTLMMQDLTEEEAIQFLTDYNTACKTCDGLQARTEWSRTEEYKQISPHFAKLWDTIEHYRQKYAERLREANLVDVHIEYEYGIYDPPAFGEDRAYIKNNGGRVYHQWPHHENGVQNAPPQGIGFCAIMKREVLTTLSSRPDIDVCVNTAPAELGEFDIEISPRLQAGKMFPYHIPLLSEVPLYRLPAERQKEIRQKMDEICNNRPRSASLEDIRRMPKGRHSWHTYSTSFHHDGPQPMWSPNSQPFSKDMRSASNHAWWLEYLPEHHERIGGLRSQMAVEQGIPAPDRCTLLALPEPAMAFQEHRRERQRLEESNAELTDKLVEAAALTKDVEFTQSRLRHRPGDEEMKDRLKSVQSNLDQLTERIQALKVDVACLQDRLDYGAMDTAFEDVGSEFEINSQQKEGRSDSATAPSLIDGQVWPAVATPTTRRGSQRHGLLTGTRPTLGRQSSQGAMSFDHAAGEMSFSVAPASSLIAAMFCNRFRRNSEQMTMALEAEQGDIYHPLLRSEEETADTTGPAAELQRARGTRIASPLAQDSGPMADTPHPTTGYLDRHAEGVPLGHRRIRFADPPDHARCIGPRDRRGDQMWQGTTAPTPRMPVTPSDWFANKTNQPAGRQVTLAVSNNDQDKAFSDALRDRKPAGRKKASTAELSLSRCDATPIDIPDINFDIPEPEPGCCVVPEPRSLARASWLAQVRESRELLKQ